MSDRPKRIQLSRRKGYRKPQGAVKVDRSTKFGNPYVVQPVPNGGRYRSGGRRAEYRRRALQCIGMFEAHLRERPGDPWLRMRDELYKLRGHDLACWCRLCPKHADGLPLGETCADCDPCHADALLRAANA